MEKIPEGKVAVVTGSGGDLGIGRAIALMFAKEGASMIVNDIGVYPDGRKMADTVTELIISQGGKAVSNYDSVATMEGGKRIIQSCIDNFGKIDILVNTAGNHIGGFIEDATEADLDSLYSIHIICGFGLCFIYYKLQFNTLLK